VRNNAHGCIVFWAFTPLPTTFSIDFDAVEWFGLFFGGIAIWALCQIAEDVKAIRRSLEAKQPEEEDYDDDYEGV
jgi:hypothetical protein